MIDCTPSPLCRAAASFPAHLKSLCCRRVCSISEMFSHSYRRWGRDKPWEAAACGRAVQCDEERRVAPSREQSGIRLGSLQPAVVASAAVLELCRQLWGCAGPEPSPWASKSCGHSVAQSRWASGLLGTPQVFLSCHPTLLCPYEHPAIPSPSAPSTILSTPNALRQAYKL